MASARLFTLSRFVFRERILCKVYNLHLTAQRCCSSNLPDSNCSISATERYKDLQMHFNRRLRAAYLRFSKIPDFSMICSQHHFYFVDTGGIYRINKRNVKSEPEQVLDLDQYSNGSEQKKHLQWIVQRMRLSPNEIHLAVTLKLYDKEENRCLIINLGQGAIFPLVEPQVILTLVKVFSFEWATDEVLFYTTLDGLRSSRVFCLDITKTRNKISSVFEETGLDVFVELALTRDQNLLTINCNNRSSSEVLLIDKNNLSLGPCLVQKRMSSLLYHIEHWKGRLIILTNTGPGKEYQVVQSLLSQPSIDTWVPLFVPPPALIIKDMEVVGHYCVLTVRTAEGEIALLVISLNQPENVYFEKLPSWACAVEAKKVYVADDSDTLEFLMSSPVQPPEHSCLLPKDAVVLPVEKTWRKLHNSVMTSRLNACSKDGTLVPITLFHASHLKSLEKVPLLIHVYGSYGRDINMEFCIKKRLLLEKGWALAYCHIRGGGECGLLWYRQACVEGKQTSVEDLVACVQHLFSSGVSSPSLTALTACSAGAVPVGALCNQHPHLIKAVTLQAPFLDVLGTMLDSSLPLTFEDREEWGDPLGNPNHKLVIASYCPFHNIIPQRYPSMLITAYNADARVPLDGIVKYTKKLENAICTYLSTHKESECTKKPNLVLNIQPGANHHGQEDFDLMLDQDALELAFLYTELGLSHRKKR